MAVRPIRRSRVRKSRSARKFRKQVGRTKKLNLTSPMRGGIRL